MKYREIFDENQVVESFDVEFDDGITVNIPADVVQTASEIAFDEDSIQVVAQKGDEWIIRDSEDPESDTFRRGIKVDATGIV